MQKPKTAPKISENPLDRDSKKRRGPRRQIQPITVLGRANNNRTMLKDVWASLWPALSQAQTAEEVKAALHDARPYDQNFLPWANEILAVMQEKRFPKRQQARINFLADSIAGIPNVSPRRSRDICVEERANSKRTHHIVRFEFLIECSCGYQGISREHACPTCGIGILFPVHFGSVFK